MTKEQSLDLAHKHDLAGDMQNTERVLLEVLARDPFDAEALHRLASVLGRAGRVEPAVNCLQRAIKTCPDDPVLWYHFGIAVGMLGRLQAAVVAFTRAVAIRPDFHQARANIAMTLLLTGDFARGWPLYESRLGTGSSFFSPEPHQPRWAGEPIAGKTLLLHHEQGFGDTIHFARYAPLLVERGIPVVLAVQPPLLRIMRSLTQNVSTPWNLRVVSTGEPLPPFDFHCPLLSVPGIVGTSSGSIPAKFSYLRADPHDTAKWSQRLGPSDGRPRVGLVWAGSATNTNDRNRSVPARQFAPLLGVPGIRLISLQTGPAAAELPALSSDPFDAGSTLADFADTAGLLENLDLLISVDTAVVHLAGALGRPAWVMTQFMPDWRWQLGRGDSPWYPSIRLFRQRFHGDWTGTVEAIRQAASQL